jgi:hypothetical protein
MWVRPEVQLTDAGLFWGLCCGLVALVISSAVNAVILRIACWFYNMQVGGWYLRNSVPLPAWGKATLICFVSSAVQLMVGGVLAVEQFAGRMSPIVANLISAPLTLVVGVLMLYAWLPTTFARAFALALIQLVFVAMIGMIMFVMFGGLELMQR